MYQLIGYARGVYRGESGRNLRPNWAKGGRELHPEGGKNSPRYMGNMLMPPNVNFLVTLLGRGGKGREGRERRRREGEGEVCVIAVGGIDAPGICYTKAVRISKQSIYFTGC